MSEATDEHCYDPELPFLAALEVEVRREAERLAQRAAHGALRSSPRASTEPQQSSAASHISPAKHVPQRSAPARDVAHERRRRRGVLQPSFRIARRSFTLVGLLCLIGATAFGASVVFSSHRANPLAPRIAAFVRAASGRAGSEHWSLRLYARGSELCRELLVAEMLASRCEAPPSAHGGAQLTSADTAVHRYLFGVTSSDALRIRVRAGSTDEIVATRPLPNANASAIRLGGTFRWYVLVLPRLSGDANPLASVAVVRLDASRGPRKHRR